MVTKSTKVVHPKCGMGCDPTLSVPMDIRKDRMVNFEGLLAKLLKDVKEIIDEIDGMLEEQNEAAQKQ